MVDVPGLLSDAYSGWEDWWHPKSVPTGAAYDPETLGSARAGAIGNLGGNLLALSQGGLSPETRAQLMLGIGKTPLTYQQSMLAGIEGRLHGAEAAQKEQEVASNKQWGDSVTAELAARSARGGGAAPVASTPGSVTPRAGTGPGVAGDTNPYRIALAALKGPESGGQAGLKNEYGYSGLYQIGTSLANSAGLYEPAKDEAVSDAKGHAVNAWRGTWNIPGFEPMSHQQFLANPAAQQAAGEKAMEHNWGDITKQGLDKYVGQTIGNVTITPQGLLQAAWLGGVGGLKTWLSGQGDPTDANKTPVSKWAALQAPGTASDAGVAQPVPQGGGSGGQPGGAGGAVAGTDAPVRRGSGLSALTDQQLTLMRGMPAKEARQYLLNLQNKIEPTPLSANAIKQYGLDPGAKWIWDENGAPKKLQDAPFQRMTDEEVKREGLNPGAKWGWDEHHKPVRIEEAQSQYLTPEEVAARPNLNPRFEYQRDDKGNIKQVGERPAELLTPEQNVAAGLHPTAVAYRKADGTLTQVTQGLTRWMTPKELEDARYPPDAKVMVKPDGSIDERDKGTNPFASMNEADAHSTLIKYAPQVQAKTLDPNTPEGRRYRAAYDMVTRGSMVQVAQDDGSKVQVYQPKSTTYPQLGEAAKQPGEGLRTEPPKQLSESQAKAEGYLRVMEAAETRLQKIMKTKGVPMTGWDIAARWTPEEFRSFVATPSGQLWHQAQVDWTLAKLRHESGANITRDEAEKENWRYFPQPGDTRDNIQQKEDARSSALNSVGVVANRADAISNRPGQGANANEPPPKAIIDEIQARLARHEITWDQAVFLAKKRNLDSFLTRPGQ